MSDIGIVGGGPAGLATAIAARLRGLTVEVFDRGTPPIDKACGEGIMPDGIERLENWGVTLSPSESSPFVGIRFVDGDLAVAGRFPGGPGLAVRRTHLHEQLVERAAELGVVMHWQTRVQGLGSGALLLEGRERPFRYLVGADGLHSKMRSWVGLAGPPATHRRFGVRRHFACPPWSDHVEVHWADRCEAYVTGTGPDRVGVAMLWSGETADFDALLHRFPVLEARLAGAAAESRDRGAGPLRQRTRGAVSGNVALVGDAAGYVDAITGEGLSLAFGEAEALAESMAGADLGRYARAHRRLRRVPEAMTTLLLVAERQPRKRRRFLRMVARYPQLFDRLLAIHARQLPPRSLGALGAVRLAACLFA